MFKAVVGAFILLAVIGTIVSAIALVCGSRGAPGFTAIRGTIGRG